MRAKRPGERRESGRNDPGRTGIGAKRLRERTGFGAKRPGTNITKVVHFKEKSSFRLVVYFEKY